MSSGTPTADAYLAAFSEVASLFDHCVTVSALHLPDQPLVFVNRQFERDTGYSAGECLGKNCRFLQGALHRQPGPARMAADIAARRSTFNDVINFRKDGTSFVNRLLLLPFEYLCDDSSQYYLGIQRVMRGVADPSVEPGHLRHGEVEAAINNPLSIALGFAELKALDSQRIDEAIQRIERYVDALADSETLRTSSS
ncbi:MAG: PAS domain-containing protein [Chromatocurvus sp.]